MLWLLIGPTGVYLLYFSCSGVRFCLLLDPCLSFVSLLYLDLYVLGEDALVGWGSLVGTRCLCVLVCVWDGAEVGAVGLVEAL